MTTIDSILEAEREAEKIIEAACAEASWVIETTKEAQTRECEEEKKRLETKEKEELLTYQQSLQTKVDTMQKESEVFIEQLRERAQKNKNQAIAVITKGLQS